jgi:hypothetical protein
MYFGKMYPSHRQVNGHCLQVPSGAKP